jgi:hypothetical protein
LRLTPEDVAKAVVSAAKRPVRARILPGISRIGVLFAAAFPGVNDWLQERTFTKPERGL